MSQALPFIHLNTRQDRLSLHMQTVGGWLEGDMELTRGGEDVRNTDDPDKNFNFVLNDDECDNIYLL